MLDFPTVSGTSGTEARVDAFDSWLALEMVLVVKLSEASVLGGWWHPWAYLPFYFDFQLRWKAH